MTASLKGFEAQTRTAQVGSEEELTLDFWLERAQGSSSICGYVRNVESGNPISLGGTVIIILPAANLYALIDHDGRYEFYGLTAGVYELWVSAPGYEDLEATVEVKEGEKKAKDFYCLPSRAVEPPWG